MLCQENLLLHHLNGAGVDARHVGVGVDDPEAARHRVLLLKDKDKIFRLQIFLGVGKCKLNERRILWCEMLLGKLGIS